MIHAFKDNSLDAIMQIWIVNNFPANTFVLSDYCRNNFAMIKSILP